MNIPAKPGVIFSDHQLVLVLAVSAEHAQFIFGFFLNDKNIGHNMGNILAGAKINSRLSIPYFRNGQPAFNCLFFNIGAVTACQEKT